MAMADTLQGLAALQTAALDFARAQDPGLATAVVVGLQTRPAIGMFEDTACSHMWDEYCWDLQEGPFDHDHSFGGMALGSISGTCDDLVSAHVHPRRSFGTVGWSMNKAWPLARQTCGQTLTKYEDAKLSH